MPEVEAKQIESQLPRPCSLHALQMQTSQAQTASCESCLGSWDCATQIWRSPRETQPPCLAHHFREKNAGIQTTHLKHCSQCDGPATQSSGCNRAFSSKPKPWLDKSWCLWSSSSREKECSTSSHVCTQRLLKSFSFRPFSCREK